MILINDLRDMQRLANRMIKTIDAIDDQTTQLQPLLKMDYRHCRSGVYFMVAKGTNTVKIGKAKCISSRIKNIQMYNPFELFCWQFINCESCEEAIRLEGMLHSHFKQLDARIRGEWFILNTVIDSFAGDLAETIKLSDRYQLVTRESCRVEDE